MPDQLTAFITLMALLFFKHYFGDAQFQTLWQVLNKGRYGHPAGFVHAGIHVGLSALMLALWQALPAPFSIAVPLPWLAAALVFEGVTHYHTDWSKGHFFDGQHYARSERDEDGNPIFIIENERFWLFLILDQCLHFLGYLGMGIVLFYGPQWGWF